jgi:hypothetical protein
MMIPSSRTPEGQPCRCPVCHREVRIEPSFPTGDAPCPHCGHLLWFEVPAPENDADQLGREIDQLDRLIETSAPEGVGSAAGWTRSDRLSPDGWAPAVPPPNGDYYTASLASALKVVVVVAAIIGFLLGSLSMAAMAAFETKTVPLVVYVCGIVSTMLVTVIVAVSLCLRDVLRQRLRAGHRVNPILRLYFASGWISLIAWIGTAVGLTFLIVTKIMG